MTPRTEPPAPDDHGPRRALRDRRVVTVMFADVVESTATTARRELEAGYAMLSSPVETVVSLVEYHGGTVNKLLGDGVMATFGAPVMLEDHAPRACRCALAIQAALVAEGSPVKIRIGINSGTALITEISAGTHRSYDTFGPMVSLGSRIEAEAAPGTVYISAATFHLLRGAFACRAVGRRSLKGFNEPQLLHELVAEIDEANPRGLSEHRIRTPLVGRARELDAVTAMLSRLQSGIGGLLIIRGEAGIGKSRLLAELRRSSPETLHWLLGRCDGFTERISFWPFIELLRPLIGVGDATAGDGWRQLQRGLSDRLGHAADDLAPYIAVLLGIAPSGDAQARLRQLDPEVLRAQILYAARRLFEHIAQRNPLVLVIEDLHWADRSSRDLLEHLLVLSQTSPVLFVVLSRPEPERLAPLCEAAQRDLPAAQFVEIVLAPLTPADSERMLTAILGGDERLARLRERILGKIEGNPFFLEEIVHELIDLGALVRHEDQSGWSAREFEIAIPQTVEGVVIARLDRLDERLRDVLSVAAVIGRTFLYRLLHAVIAADVDEPLARLSTCELIEELRSAPELAYLFRHPLTHQAVYDSLLLERRRHLHARVAAILAELYAGRTQEITSLLAFHFARAETPQSALPYLIEAAEQSGRMAADGEALQLLEEALATQWKTGDTTADAGQRARIEWQVGDIHFRRGEHEIAETHLLQALALSGDPMPKRRVGFGLALAREVVCHVAWMLGSAMRRRELGGAIAAADEARLLPYQTLGWIYFLSDQTRLLLVMLRSANRASGLGYREGVAKTLAAVGFGLTVYGLPRLTAHYHRRAKTIAGSDPGSTEDVFVDLLWGTQRFISGRWREAEDILRDVEARADRVGDLLMWSDAAVQLCEIWCETGEFSAALTHGANMTTRGRETAFRPAVRWGLMAQGKALRRSGRIADACAALDEAAALSAADRDIVAGASVGGDRAMAWIALDRGDEAAVMLDGLRRKLVAGRLRVYTACSVYTALAALALAGAASGTGSLGDARRACAAVRRLGRVFSMARPAALRLEGRLALQSGFADRADRLWRRGIAVARDLGAHYELSLIERELAARSTSR